ncbi:SIMPL domain-containing protein [Granulicella arctica]|uniref:SIMPL domain-containing protein n=1 Tax=Granulicella arctica TaxID=940613 RepID=UPI0021DF8A9D|nr:SIMPL domain-containing protein [Granulicella arctica]
MKLHLSLTLLAFPMALSVASAQTIQVNKDNRTIAITATDKATAQADIATLHIGFIAYGPDNDTAYATGSRLSNAIHNTLTAAGIHEDAIESENQAVSPVEDYATNKLTPAEKQQRKFQVTQSWIVRSNADESAKLLDLAVKAGANQSGQIDWSLKDQNAPAAEAAAKALQRARTVAEQMARSLNVKLGALIYATNQTEAEPIRPINSRMTVPAPMMAMQKVAPLAINPRRVETSATVFAIE